jgi:hypothetical protein
MSFIGDLSQSRWEQESVQFGRNGSPVAAVLCVNALDCSVREGPSALPCREAMCLYIAMQVSIYTGGWEGQNRDLTAWEMTSYHQRQGAVGVPPEDAKMKRASTTCKECQKRRTRVQTTSHPPFPSLPYPTLSLSRSLSPPSFCPRCVLSSAIWTFSSVDPSSAL